MSYVESNRAHWDDLAPSYAPQAGLHRVSWESDPGVEFHLGHDDWIRLLRRSGFDVEDMIELYASDDAEPASEYVTADWARRWPVEEVWFARRN